MSLSFTAPQINTMSKDALTLPDKVNNPQTGFIAQKANYAALAPSLLATDGNQKVFSDNFIASINAYHAELVLLNLSQKTNYADAKITEAAQGTKGAGTHFPTDPPAWTSLIPKLIPSSTGLPVTTAAGPSEPQDITQYSGLITTLTTGFTTSPHLSFSGTYVANVITTSNDVTGLANGTKILVFVGGTAAFATVQSTAPNIPVPTDTDVTILITSGSLGSGSCSAQNFFPGFTNAQRSGTTSLGIYSNVYTFLKTDILAAVTLWKNNLLDQKAALMANSDQVNTAHVATALANVNTALSAITTWQGLTDLVVNGLLSDNGLAPLNTAASNRSSQGPARVTEIGTDLGAITQNPDGTYSGSGAYLGLFKVVDLRAALGVGTLSKYYDNIRNQGLFDKQITSANDQIAQYQSVMYVSKILANTTVGQDTFSVDTVTGLAVSDPVLVMDNTSITYSRTISQIVGTSVKLNSGIPIILTLSNLARIVKMR